MIEITLKRSPIATTPNQKDNLKGLGLRRREQTVTRIDTPSVRGMIRKVIHLVDVRVAEKGTKLTKREVLVEVIPPKEGSVVTKSKAKKKVQKKEKKS